MKRKWIYIGLGVIIYVLLLKYMFHIFFPFICAMMCYLIIKPFIDKLDQKYAVHRHTIGISLLLTIYLLIAFVFGVIVVYGFIFIYDLLQQFPSFYQSTLFPFIQFLFDYIHEHFRFLEQIDITMIQDIYNQYFLTFLTSLSSFFTHIPTFFFSFSLFIISTFFLVIDYEDMRFSFFKYVSQNISYYLVMMKKQCLNGLLIYVKCQMILMMICFFILLFGFTILKMNQSLLLAMITALLDSLPFIGVGIILIPMCLFYVIQRNYLIAFYLFLLYLIINMIRSLLEPRIMNKQMKIPSFILLFSMILHIYLFGIIGVILSPIHMNIIYCLLEEKNVS